MADLIRMRIFITLAALFVLLLATSVHASISDITFQSDELITVGSINYLIPERPTSVMLSFRVAPEIDVLYVDFAELNQNLTTAQPGSLNPGSSSFCTNRLCTFRVTLYKNIGGPALSWSYGFPGTEFTTVQFPVQEDNTAPTFLRLGTPACQQDCALPVARTATVRAHFSETGTGMDASTVIARIGSTQFVAATCTQATCDIPLTVPSSAVQDGRVLITITSARDRSGNAVVAPSMNASFTVDNIAPRIVSVVAQTNNQNMPEGVVTGSFVLVALVDESSQVTAVADVSAVSDAANANAAPMQCTTATPKRCTLNVAPADGITGEHDITVTVTDAAGLEAETARITVRVLETATGSLQTTWTATGDIRPGVIDLGVAKLFSQRLFITNTEIRAADFGVEIAAVRVERCLFRTDGRPVQVPMGTPTVMGRATDPTFMLPFSPMGDALANSDDRLDIECQLAITAIKDGRIYTTPQRTTLRTTVRLEDNPSLPVRIEKMQRDATAKAERLSKTAGTMRGTYAGLTSICQVKNIMESSEIAGRVVASALSLIPLVGQGASVGVHVGANSVEQARNRLGALPIGGDTFCDRMMCTGSSTGFTNNAAVEAVERHTVGLGADKIPGFETAANVTTGNAGTKGFMNPYKSFPIAVVQMCIPAMISHVETYSQIQCEYSRCLSQDVTIGMPVSACLGDRDFQTCRMVGGAIFWTSPGAVLQTMRNAVVDVLNNPLTWPVIANSYVCAPVIEVNGKSLCRLPALIQSAAKKAQAIQQLTQIQQSLQGMSKTCSNTPVLRDDFYGVIPDAQGIVCNQAYCDSSLGDLQSGRFIARPTADGIKYSQVQPITNAQGQIIRDAQGNPTYTTESIDADMVPRSVRTNLEARAQQLRSFDSRSPEFQNAINSLPEIQSLYQQLNAVQSFNAPGATQAAQQLTGNILPSPAANAPATPPAAAPPAGNPPSGNPAGHYTAQSGQQGYDVARNSFTLPLPQGYRLGVGTGYLGRSTDSVTLPAIAPGSQISTTRVGQKLVIRFTQTGGTEATISINPDGSSNRVYTKDGKSNVYIHDASGTVTNQRLGIPARQPTAPSTPSTPSTAVPSTPSGTGSPQPGTAPAPNQPSPGQVLLDGFKIEQELETLKNQLATLLGPTTDGDMSAIAAQRNTLQRQIAAKEAQLDRLGFDQPGVLTPLSFMSNLNALTGAYGTASAFYSGTSSTGLAGVGLTAAATVADRNQVLLIDFSVRLEDAFKAGNAATIAELYDEFNALTAPGAPLARMAEDVALFEQTREAFAKEVANRLDEESEREARIKAQVDARSTVTYRLTYAMQNARAVMGITNALPVGMQKKLGNVINNGFAQSDLAQSIDFEARFIDAMCLRRDDVNREGALVAFTANNRPGLAFTAYSVAEFSDELIAVVEELESVDWAELGVAPPLLPDVSQNDYTYVITGMINTDPRPNQEPREFTIVLRGSAGEVTVETGLYPYGQPSTLAQSKSVTTTEQYDRACLVLQEPLQELFSRTTATGYEYCVAIRNN